MNRKRLSKILFFISFAEIVRALICVLHATVILDETDAQNPILAHNIQIPISSKERTIDYLAAPAGTSLTEIPYLISQARQSKELSSHIPLNQQDEILNYPWYVNDDIFVESPMPGQITKIDSQKGQKLTRGQELCMIEAMKMECVIRSPIDGEVIDVLFKVGNRVGTQPIVKLRPLRWKSINFYDILDNQVILSTLFPWESSTANALPTEDLITVLSEETKKQTKPSQPVSVLQTISTESTPITNDQPHKLSFPLDLVKESSAPILLKNNDDIFFQNRNVHVQPILLPLNTQSQKKVNLDFSEKEIFFPSVDEKQIVLSTPVSVPQPISTESTIVTNRQPFKASSLIDKVKGKGHPFHSKSITAKKLYNDAPIKFLSQKQNFKSFMNVHKLLCLLIILYFFAFAFERIGALFRRRTISLQAIHSAKFMSIFYKPAHNQNFSQPGHIKFA
jgi:biotin carboxyl carrier protein